MKRLAVSMILAVVLSLLLAIPAFGAPPPDAGAGAEGNDGLSNAIERLLDVANKNGYYDPLLNVYLLQGNGPPSINKP